MTPAFEYNFDGLVGPTHNYAGLSAGNVASMKHGGQISSPKDAAKQGLRKMKALHDLGLKQGVLAPQQRPDLQTLRRIGFTGTDSQVIEKAFEQAPQILAACFSASSMWTANAATVSPSADTGDQRVHFTPASLSNKFHRSLEPETTARILKATFPNEKYFVHHDPLPRGEHFGDEGAANHTRFCREYGEPGIEFFVFGRYAFDGQSHPAPRKFPARQTYEASSAIARLHQLSGDRSVFAQQNPEVIDQGVFHNDVISVGNQNVFFCHERAFINQQSVLDELKRKFGDGFEVVVVRESEVSVADCVGSYLFNSQLLTLPGGEMVLIAPEECRSTKSVWTYLSRLVQSETPIRKVQTFDLKQSMRNGGGPACLRLRVVLNSAEEKAVNPATVMSEKLFQTLDAWIDRHYRDRLSLEDFQDPKFLVETHDALDELTGILGLQSVYPFQL